MKAVLAIILVMIMSTMAIAVDSEIIIFDEAQRSDARFIDSEIRAWKQIDLQSAQYHEEWKKYYDLHRKRNRLVFLYKLQNKPNSIDWSHWMGWTDPIDSTIDLEAFKKTMPHFKELTGELESQMKLIKTLRNQLKRRNSFYQKNIGIFNRLEVRLTGELMALQDRMDKVRQAQQSTALVPSAR